MAISTVFGSIGFAARFIIAFVIIAYLYAQDKTDASVRRGFVLLCSLGAVVFVLGVLAFLGVFVFGGLGFLGNALTDFQFHHYYF